MAEYKGKLLKGLVQAKNVLLNNGASVEDAINGLKISHIEKTTTISANSDKNYTLSEILDNTSISSDDVIGVVSWTMRPVSAWSQVQTLSFYVSTNNQWGFHNIGTGGNAVADFFILHR